MVVLGMNDLLPYNGTSQKLNKQTEKVIRKRGCFIDCNNNNVCDNYEAKICRKADFNEKDRVKKSNLCDGSGYSLLQKKALKKIENKKGLKGCYIDVL